VAAVSLSAKRTPEKKTAKNSVRKANSGRTGENKQSKQESNEAETSKDGDPGKACEPCPNRVPRESVENDGRPRSQNNRCNEHYCHKYIESNELGPIWMN
jgi:hypothetical protein